jgi:hypothetical protein
MPVTGTRLPSCRICARKRTAAKEALARLLSRSIKGAAWPHVTNDRRPGETGSSDGEDEVSVASRVYAEIRRKLIGFEWRPGARLKEEEIASALNTSRPSVREALSRLVAEKLAVWKPNHGFSLRTLDTKEVFDLYELRAGLESQLVKLAIERGSADQLRAFERAWLQALTHIETPPMSRNASLPEGTNREDGRGDRNTDKPAIDQQ